jgi:putative tricarboxylic transport membrane protein
VRHLIKAVAALTAVLASAPVIAAGWEPTKPVEIVVAAGAGGASDQMARMMQAAIQKNNLMKQPMVVSLKGGASGWHFGRGGDLNSLRFSRQEQVLRRSL